MMSSDLATNSMSKNYFQEPPTTFEKVFYFLLTLAFLGSIIYGIHAAITKYPVEEPQIIQEANAATPEHICVWGENEDGSCLELDPCVYSNVECPSELKKENRMATIERMIREAAIEHEVWPDTAVRIAKCESTLNEYAANSRSTAKGLFQFTDSTWAYIKAEGHQFDAEENIKQFMIWYVIHPE